MRSSKPKIIAVIPARFASTRFMGKMLANIMGKSLVQRTYENTLQSKLLDKVVVATDHNQIFDHVESFGGEVYMTKEAPSGTDRVAELVEKYFSDTEIIVNVQGDEPCLNPFVIDALVQKLINTPEALMATAVTPIKDASTLYEPSVVKCVFNNEQKALYFSRAPIPFCREYKPSQTYYRHIGVYAFRASFLKKYASLPKTSLQGAEDLEQLKILEHGYAIHVCPVITDAIGVDMPDDIKKVENYLCRENTSLLQEELSLL